MHSRKTAPRKIDPVLSANSLIKSHQHNMNPVTFIPSVILHCIEYTHSQPLDRYNTNVPSDLT